MANRDNDETADERDNSDEGAEELYTLGLATAGAAVGMAAMEDSPISGMVVGGVLGYTAGKATAKQAIKAARTGALLPDGAMKKAKKLLKG